MNRSTLPTARTRRRMLWLLSLCLFLAGAPAPVTQMADARPAVSADTETRNNTPAPVKKRGYFVDYVIVAALFAAAIYAVCRSSRRT